MTSTESTREREGGGTKIVAVISEQSPPTSRVARCTKRLVERVRAKTLAHPKITAGILEAMDQVRGEFNIYTVLL